MKALRKVKMEKKITLEKLIRISKDFSVERTLIRDKRVEKLIKDIEKTGNAASMVMLGHAVYSDKPFRGSTKVAVSKKGAFVIR